MFRNLLLCTFATLVLMSTAYSDGGLSGGLKKADKKEDTQEEKDKKWVEKLPPKNKANADATQGSKPDEKNAPKTKQPSKPIKPIEVPRPRTIDDAIKDLEVKIAELQTKRQSTDRIKNVKSRADAKKLVDLYDKLAKAEPDTEKRYLRIKALQRELAEAKALIAKAANLSSKSIKLPIAMNVINRELLDVYIASRQLRLLDLKWERESYKIPIEAVLKTNSIQLDFIAWENNPLLTDLPRSGGSLTEGMKDVRALMGQKKSRGSLLATMSLKLKVTLVKFRGGRQVIRVSSNPESTTTPRIPNAMRKKRELRVEATQLELNYLPALEIELSPDRLRTLRKLGVLMIDLKSIEPISRLSGWVLVDSNNAILEVTAIK